MEQVIALAAMVAVPIVLIIAVIGGVISRQLDTIIEIIEEKKP